MGNSKKDILPKYQQVAISIAERIVSNQYPVGQKVHARSTLANTFSVSPETARKAVNVLVDLGIMEAKHGSGVTISSKEKAKAFLTQYENVRNIQEIKTDVLKSIIKQQEELENLAGLTQLLVAQTKQLNQINPLLPSELLLTKQSLHLGETIQSLNIWQETSATIIAILRGEDLLISPGPYAVINEMDTLFFIGDEFAKQRLTNFFYPTIA